MAKGGHFQRNVELNHLKRGKIKDCYQIFTIESMIGTKLNLLNKNLRFLLSQFKRSGYEFFRTIVKKIQILLLLLFTTFTFSYKNIFQTANTTHNIVCLLKVCPSTKQMFPVSFV